MILCCFYTIAHVFKSSDFFCHNETNMWYCAAHEDANLTINLDIRELIGHESDFEVVIVAYLHSLHPG